MSYDLVFWRGGEDDSPDAIWEALCEGDVPDALKPLDVDHTLSLLRQVEVQESHYEGLHVIVGHGWETAFPTDEPVSHIVVSCAWSLLDGGDAFDRFETVLDALEASGLMVFDPQAGDYGRP